MSRVFVSYRRMPSRPIALRIAVRLKRMFGSQHVFFDLDSTHSIDVGEPWKKKIQAALESCDIFIVVIGEDWVSPRLHDENDWVRRELLRVFERNDEAEKQGKDQPVFILPLLINKAPRPRTNDLPECLRPLGDLQTFRVTIDPKNPKRLRSDLNHLVAPIEKHLGEPPTGHLGFAVFSKPPRNTNSKGFEYRYRAVRKRADLTPFVDLSDREGDITDTNPGLKGPTRRKLYADWCEWTATKPNIPWTDPKNQIPTFLILERRTATTNWKAIGVSIILPLSPEGRKFLTTPQPGKKVNASQLKEWHLSRGKSTCLLLDTWIIGKKRATKQKPPPRHEHDHWGCCLVLRHLAEFWKPNWERDQAGVKDSDRLTILVEPDNHKIDQMLTWDLRFSSMRRNRASGSILALEYPPDLTGRGPEFSEGMTSLIKNMNQCRKIKLFRD